MYKYRPSKAARAEFARKMTEIDQFCDLHNIRQSASSDSYYFTVNGIYYRVSNHSVEASNAAAYDECGHQRRDLYHPFGRDADTVYIHASKTRIMDIYTDLLNGYQLDGRGNRK